MQDALLAEMGQGVGQNSTSFPSFHSFVVSLAAMALMT